MKPHYEDATTTVYAGDCLDVLRGLPDASVDAVCTDPPYSLSFMGRDWDSHSTPAGFQAWCLLWAAECLRVLKPGGHLLAFGGTRTYHRLACAVEDAGFEVRDSIAWLYGSGFPKSLDVSKAIDKQRHDADEKLRVTAWLADIAEQNGVTRADVDAHMGTSDMGGWWLSRLRHRCAIPTLDQVPLLLDALKVTPAEVPDEIRALLIDLNGMKGQPGPAWFDREVTGSRFRAATGRAEQGTGGYAFGEDFAETAPATPDAERWQGWGTALKPSHEPVVVARKPLSDLGILATIGSHLDTLEQAWQAPEADPTTPTGAAGDSPDQTATSPSVSGTPTSSSIVSSWRACWVELCGATSTSTTETTSSTTTALTTLSSSLAKLTAASTPTSPTSQPGQSSLASVVDNLFASAVFASRATLALSVTAPATSSTPRSPLDAADGSPAFEPVVVARKPLSGTVAQTVLAHGTGALNVDATRIGGDTDTRRSKGNNPSAASAFPHSDDAWVPHMTHAGTETGGRWPANVVLDGSQAEALDQQSGALTSGKLGPGHTDRGKDAGSLGAFSGREIAQEFGGEGGASRFFYTAKAASDERVRVNGTAHPTVKPLALMRWLVRLVTPPGGTVLEPFAGSGTTVEACILEGFRCIAIEREADYLPLIQQRIDRRRDPVAAVKAAGDDGGLFDLLEGADCLEAGQRRGKR